MLTQGMDKVEQQNVGRPLLVAFIGTRPGSTVVPLVILQVNPRRGLDAHVI